MRRQHIGGRAMSLTFAVPESALWRDELWDTVLDLSGLLDDDSWVLVGFQAVTAHALARGVDEVAVSSRDETPGRLVTSLAGMPGVMRALTYLGFEAEGLHQLHLSQFRYTRGAEGAARENRAQSWVVHVAGAADETGGDQALDRREPYLVSKGMRAPLVPVPSLLASIVYEAAQFGTNTTAPFVHARDTAFLVSLLEDPAAARAALTAADLRTLRSLDAAVGHPSHSVWRRLPAGRDAFGRWKLLLAV